MIRPGLLDFVLVLLVSSTVTKAASGRLRSVLPRGNILYQGAGNSYAAGPGAGETLEGGSCCQKYTGSYPYWLNRLINNGAELDLNNHLACTGAMAEDVQAEQHINPIAQLVTMSVGGNNVGFGDIVNDCIYRFKGVFSGDCDQTLQSSHNAITTELSGEVKTTLENILHANTHPDSQLYLTGYVKFWDSETDRCDTVSWDYWQNSSENGSGDKMTEDRRRQMNSLVNVSNRVLDGVVAEINEEGDYRVHFVNIDGSFKGCRFCEDGIVEPQRSGEDRQDTWIFQHQMPTGQLWGPSETTGAVGPAADWARGAQRASRNDPSLRVSDYYASQPIPLGDDYTTAIPVFIAKVFHPTQAGHAAMANAVHAAIIAAGLRTVASVVGSIVNQLSTATATSSGATPAATTSTLATSAVALSCTHDCRGYDPDPDWCGANCPCFMADGVC